MTLRRLKTYLIVTVLVTVGAFGGILAAGEEPVLGLDLQGGISIVYEAVGKTRPGALDVPGKIASAKRLAPYAPIVASV